MKENSFTLETLKIFQHKHIPLPTDNKHFAHCITFQLSKNMKYYSTTWKVVLDMLFDILHLFQR